MEKVEKFEHIIEMYKAICGVIKEEDIQKIIEFHNIKVTEEEIKKLMLKDYEYIDGYYTNDKKMVNKEYLSLRNNLPIRLISQEEFSIYGINILRIEHSLADILDSNELAEQILTFETAFKSFSEKLDEEFLKQLLDKFNITKDKYNEVRNLFDEEGYKIRYWMFYGRTFNEYELDCLFNEIYLKEYPKNNTLKECISLLEDDIKEMVYAHNQVDDKNEEKLIKTIVESFRLESDLLTKEIYDALIKQEFSYYLYEEDYLSGFAFAYLDNGIKKIIVPKEIQEELQLINREDLESEEEQELEEMFGNFDDELTNQDYVMDYISMNGIIEKDKLKEIILKNHNIELSKDEIEEIIKNFDVYTIEDKYYSLLDDKNDAIQLLSLKTNNDDYKVLTLDIHYLEEEFLDEIDFFVEDNWKDKQLQEEISSFIWITCKFGIFNKDSLESFKIEYNLSNKDLRIIEGFVKEYKNIVAIWPFNGYTLNEKKQVKKEKIGRNDPCPCGSGKKYKQCCGK